MSEETPQETTEATAADNATVDSPNATTTTTTAAPTTEPPLEGGDAPADEQGSDPSPPAEGEDGEPVAEEESPPEEGDEKDALEDEPAPPTEDEDPTAAALRALQEGTNLELENLRQEAIQLEIENTLVTTKDALNHVYDAAVDSLEP